MQVELPDAAVVVNDVAALMCVVVAVVCVVVAFVCVIVLCVVAGVVCVVAGVRRASVAGLGLSSGEDSSQLAPVATGTSPPMQTLAHHTGSSAW